MRKVIQLPEVYVLRAAISLWKSNEERSYFFYFKLWCAVQVFAIIIQVPDALLLGVWALLRENTFYDTLDLRLVATEGIRSDGWDSACTEATLPWFRES